MPKMLQVRNVPDDVHATLKRRAAEAGVSLSELVGRELRALAERPTQQEIFARVRARGGSITIEDAVGTIRDDRDTG